MMVGQKLIIIQIIISKVIRSIIQENQSKQRVLLGLGMQLIIKIIITSNSQMDIHQSPIKIVSKVNIPDVGTPNAYSSKQNFSSHSRKSTMDVLETKRTQILLLKDTMQYPLAFQKANQLIRSYPRDARLLQLKAQITFLMKQYTIALQIYQQLLDSASSSENLVISNPLLAKHRDMSIQQQKKLKALYLYNKALCLQKLNRGNEAIQALKESIQINKHRIQSYVLLAQLYRQGRNLAKVYKIYRKILQKNRKSEYLFKAIRICQQQKEYQQMLNLIQTGLKWDNQGVGLEGEQNIKQLLRLKGEALRKMKKYEQAIQVYNLIIQGELNETKLVKIYSKIAICYDFTGNLSKACEYYKKILLINQNSMETINNLANLQIRRKHYLQAINVLNTGILKLLAETSTSENSLTLSLLRSHRVIAFAKLGLIAQAKKDLQEIVGSIKESKQMDLNHQQGWENYKFVRYIVQKYQICSEKINCIKKQSENQLQEVVCIEKELVCSISQSLQKPISSEQAKNNLDELSSRIDRLYNEIVAFKKATLVQHQSNADKVHNKIAEIEQILNKKEQETAKLQKELQQLKQQNQNIYNFVLQLKQSNNREYSEVINTLKKQNKHQVASYIQSMYWTFNIYFVSIRLVANGLVQSNKNIHLNKVSAFFAKFKKVFQTVSKLPHIGIVCEIITSIISLYLTEEHHLVYKGLNEIITKKYATQKALQHALELALVNLAKSDYVQDLFKKQKHSITSEMNLYKKACEWFREKKNKLIEKMFKIDSTSTPEQKVIQETVIEDVSATFVYLIKNKSTLMDNFQSQPCKDVLFEAIDKNLVQGCKKNEIKALYAKQTGNCVKKEKQGESCSKCILY